MGKSVKLTDGSYIDAEGVYDATQGKTQAELNSLETYSDTTNGIYYQKVGKLVLGYAILASMTFAAYESKEIAALPYAPVATGAWTSTRFLDPESRALNISIRAETKKFFVHNTTGNSVTAAVRCPFFYFTNS